MPPSRWFAFGSADGSESGAGARTAGEALVHDDATLLVVFCSQYGEIARTQDIPGFHNQTPVVLSIA